MFEDLKEYLTSLDKMRKYANGKGYPGHGAVIEDCKDKIDEYIKHRQQREDEVHQVLKYGRLEKSSSTEITQQPPTGTTTTAAIKSWTPIELVKVIYWDVPEELHLPASHGVIQVLLKLEEEGKVKHEQESGRWNINLERPAL